MAHALLRGPTTDIGVQPGLAHHRKIVSNGIERVLGSKEVGVVVKPGDSIYCLSAGGGGYGDPQARAKPTGDWDVKNGYVR